MESPNKAQGIKALSIGQEKRTINHTFTPSEIEEKTERYLQVNMELNGHEEEFEIIKKKHKETITPLRDEAKLLLSDIKRKSESRTIECFMVDNQEEGIMEYYDDNGTMVDSRKLRPEERQTNFLRQINTGS